MKRAPKAARGLRLPNPNARWRVQHHPEECAETAERAILLCSPDVPSYTCTPMPCGRKRKRHKIATHKRKKRLRKNRHKKKSR